MDQCRRKTVKRSTFDTAGFLRRHMDFGDRKFDIVLLWDALDYIPGPLADAILQDWRLCWRRPARR